MLEQLPQAHVQPASLLLFGSVELWGDPGDVEAQPQGRPSMCLRGGGATGVDVREPTGGGVVLRFL